MNGYMVRARLAPGLIASIPTMAVAASLRGLGTQHLVALAASTLVVLAFYGLAGRGDHNHADNEQTEDGLIYGYRRNLLAVKLPSILLSIIIALGCALLDPSRQDMTVSYVFLVIFLHTTYLMLFVSRKRLAEARRILERDSVT